MATVSKQVWVIMDKAHRVIACGVPRHRHLMFVENALGDRPITYGTEGKARSGYKVSGFYLDETGQYMTDTYGKVREFRQWNSDEVIRRKTFDQRQDSEAAFEPVLITLTIDVPD